MKPNPCRVMLSFGLILGLSLEGGWTAEPLRPFRTDVPPVLDGRLDDPVWRTAPQETGFITYYPDFGAAMSEPTWVWYAYDRENLYFAFQCRDSRPDQIKTSVSARDKIRQDDWICINLDTYNDQQAIYALYVNPAGIQMDSRATSNSEDIGIDLVWYSEARVDSLGYSVEMKIPLKSLRFPRRNPVEMAVIFERHISRRSEAGTYPPLDPAKGNNFLIQTRPLLYQDIAFHNLFEILPAVTYTNNRTVDQGRWISEDNRGEASLTAKYGITSDFILDAAVNPDFSQVESDAGQIDFNQRYALYYPEKRPFFLEGRDHFVFGASNEDDPMSMVLHTRTIADPLVGFRLTGKFGKRHSLDAMYALDELPGDLGQGEYAHAAVLRYKRALRSDGFLGGFVTLREPESGGNRVLGTDGQVRIGEGNLLGFHGFVSQTPGQDPQIGETGHALGINHLLDTREWVILTRVNDLSQGFRADLGYLTRTGLTQIRSNINRWLYPRSAFFKRIRLTLDNSFLRDKFWNDWERANGLSMGMLFPRTSTFHAGVTSSSEIYLGKRMDTSFLYAAAASQIHKDLYFSIYGQTGRKIRYVSDPYPGHGIDASFSIVFQPSEKWSTVLSASYSDFFRESDGAKEFDYGIVRFRNTYQMNRYLFFRAILEYNSFYETLTTDFLASFTYIPGTVIHIGYGSLYEQSVWSGDTVVASDRFHESRRGFFFKTSYLWRM